MNTKKKIIIKINVKIIDCVVRDISASNPLVQIMKNK